ncbi:MAG: pimeloyl-ACP methyl esterase BioG family protein [Pseudomonadota bacterium]
MISTWLHQQQQEQLIIFCNGWGMDATPFQPLGAREYDVLMLSDYRDLTLDFDPATLFSQYQRSFLISWSMGVWAGQQIFQPWLHCLQGAMAINGTLCPIHDQFGIPVQLYGATLEQFSATSRLKFYRRMCRDRQPLDTFLGHQPQRSVESQTLELAALQGQVTCQPAESAIYGKVVIAAQDMVVPSANQLAFWQGREIRRVEGAHFLFYGWNSWDNLLGTLV